MNLEWTFLPTVAVAVALGAMALTLAFGLAGTLAALRQRPLALLRNELSVEGARQTRPPWRLENQMANPNFGAFNRAGTVADQASFDVGLRAHMVRVYNYMASGLALSGIVAFALYNFEGMQTLFFQMGRTPGGAIVPVGMNALGWVATLAPLGLLLLVSFRAAQMSTAAVQAVYWAVTALMGVSLSV
eukprot:gene5107-6775_t